MNASQEKQKEKASQLLQDRFLDRASRGFSGEKEGE